MRRFIIVVDTQHDFMDADGALSVSGAAALAAPMQDWLAALNPAETEGVLFTFDTHLPDSYPHSAEAEMFPIHCLRGTPGWANVLDSAALDPGIPVYRLEKGVFDMWAEPELRVEAVGTGERIDREDFFSRLKERGVLEVTVIGVAADYCVRWAVAGLLERGFSVLVPPGLTRGIERQIEAVAAGDFPGATLRVGAA